MQTTVVQICISNKTDYSSNTEVSTAVPVQLFEQTPAAHNRSHPGMYSLSTPYETTRVKLETRLIIAKSAQVVNDDDFSTPSRAPEPLHRYAGHYGAAREKNTDSKEHRRTHRQRQTKREKIYMCLFSDPPTNPRNERNSNTATTERTHDATAHQRARHAHRSENTHPSPFPPPTRPAKGRARAGEHDCGNKSHARRGAPDGYRQLLTYYICSRY